MIDMKCSPQDTDASVIRIYTASNFIAPGFRMGWPAGRKRFMERIAQHMMVSSHGLSNMTGMLIERILDAWGDAGFDKHIRDLQLTYCKRAALISNALEEHLVRIWFHLFLHSLLHDSLY